MSYADANRNITVALIWIAALLLLYTGWLNIIRQWITKLVA